MVLRFPHRERFLLRRLCGAFLTGKKRDMEHVLTGLDVYTEDFTDHPPVVLVGDGRTGV